MPSKRNILVRLSKNTCMILDTYISKWHPSAVSCFQYDIFSMFNLLKITGKNVILYKKIHLRTEMFHYSKSYHNHTSMGLPTGILSVRKTRPILPFFRYDTSTSICITALWTKILYFVKASSVRIESWWSE